MSHESSYFTAFVSSEEKTEIRNGFIFKIENSSMLKNESVVSKF